MPQGRIAEWTGWRMLGLTNHNWGDIHITTSLQIPAASSATPAPVKQAAPAKAAQEKAGRAQGGNEGH